MTATEIEEIRNELRECFSEEGMHRFMPDSPPKIEEKSIHIHHEENTQYQFNCSNLKIAIAGCDRRVGVTTTAMNLVCWINAHGGTACYVEANPNNHRHISFICLILRKLEMPMFWTEMISI
ncbi:hypothetical protein HPL003_02130 [Paenibacillus terrae HPL-003]|uniref:Uncharacterized protein n=1 Tax=Paenibacillus terrae (strain HPL-003) TaxID=985665 RepID=G7VY29_PAETH|nr:hypothetical protein [Paenibacillus terrae]AET57207.1 hypothetical protein HPL003_02130 [Paenibacillus terrae HPL-003]